MKAVTWQGVHDMQVTRGPGPADRGADGRDHQGHVDRPVRLRPAPLRDPRPVHGGRRHRRPRADGHRRGGRPRGHATSRSATASSCRSTSAAARAGCATRASTASARPRRTTSTAPARASSATASSTARSPAARRSTSASRSPTSCPSRCRTSTPTTGSSSSPTSCRPRGRALKYADVPDGGTLLVLGAGPIGDMAARMGVRAGPPRHLRRPRAGAARPRRGVRRRAAQPRRGREGRRRGRRRPRGSPMAAAPTPSSTPSAWRPTAHRRRAACVQKFAGLLPDAISEPMMKKAGLDRLAALHTAIDAVRRGGTISISGVYGGAGRPDADDAALRQADPGPDGPGQRARLDRRAARRCWSRTTRSASTPSPPTTSRSTEAPDAYEHFQKKEEGMVKVVFQP